jgi:predicted metal-dependent hydrolase
MQLELDLPVEGLPSLEHKAKYWIQLVDVVIPYVLIRTKRRTLSLVYQEQGLRVNAPLRLGLNVIESFIVHKSSWVLQQRARYLEMQKHRPLPMMAWQHDTEFLFLGETIRLRLDAGNAAPKLLIQDGVQYLSVQLTPELPRDMVVHVISDWLKAQAKLQFANRLAIFAEKMNLPMPTWRLSNAKRHWGSCNAKGHIRLNWRLIYFPLMAIDYVIVHELAHVIELNHSEKFWQIVKDIFPDYLAAQRLLREQAFSYVPTV